VNKREVEEKYGVTYNNQKEKTLTAYILETHNLLTEGIRPKPNSKLEFILSIQGQAKAFKTMSCRENSVILMNWSNNSTLPSEVLDEVLD